MVKVSLVIESSCIFINCVITRKNTLRTLFLMGRLVGSVGVSEWVGDWLTVFSVVVGLTSVD